MKKKKRLYFQNLMNQFTEISPSCTYFDKCGGCMFQNISYNDQLNLKKIYLNELLEGIVQIDSVFPSVDFGYRNRMDMVTAFGKIGLREEGSYKFVVDIDDCKIMQNKMNSIYNELHPLLKEIDGYNYLSHKGYLRYIILRQAMFTEQLMVNFVIADRENRIQHIIDKIYDRVDSISLILNDGLADLSFGEIIEDVKGGYIEEKLEDLTFRIKPNSFFQSNSYIALEMYKKIRENVSGKVLDLYSGVGSISLFVASNAKSVTAVEVVGEAVEIANINKEINNISNVEFLCQDAKEFMREYTEEVDTLILDPPRSGMNPKMLKYINAIAPKRIIYMSCNPATFKIDFELLEGYTLKSFEAFDMFPQTPHVETLAVLDRQI